MLRWIAMWAVRVTMAAAATFALLYLGDWAVFAARGGPRGSVAVDHTLVVPLKGNKREYVEQGAALQPCAEALFGQNGLDACWQLKRNPHQETTY